MPVLGFGTSQIKETEPIYTAIVKAGYRHIDTATRYANEEYVGEAIEKAIAEGAVKREDLFITTKLWHSDYSDPEAALKLSLQKLKLDYVDLYLIHWPNNFFTDDKNKVPMHVLWPKMEALVDSGLAKSIGVSNFNTQLLADIMTYCLIKPACNQIQIHPMCAQEELVDFLMAHNIMPVAYSPIGRIGQASGPTINILEHDDTGLLETMGTKYGKTAYQIILNWGLARGYAVIPKASSLKHQESNFQAKDFRLEDADVKAITDKFN